jgi:hypothetical protein
MTPSPSRDLSKIRGWLLFFVVILIPHGLGAPFGIALELPLDQPVSGMDVLRVTTLAVIAVGNLLGVFLILSRNRIAPAFFTLYPLLLVLLYLLDPDPIATVNARLAALDSTGGLAPIQLRVLEVVNLALVALIVGYWAKSKRVQAVFGSRGLGLFWGAGRR